MVNVSLYVASVIESCKDVGHLLRVVAGREKHWDVVPGNIVSTEVSLAKPETLMPLVIGLTVAFMYIRVIEEAGRRVARALGLRKGKVESFASSWCEAVYFSVQIFISYRLFSGADWFWPSGWSSAMDDGRAGVNANGLAGAPPYHCTREVRAYYVCEFGYYATMLVTIFFKKRKKDFKEMVFHHLVTSILILVSYANWHLRIGIIVMMIHNLFDPFLNIAKMAHYAFTGPAHVIADISFGIGAVVFLITRLIMYPCAIYSTWAYGTGIDGEEGFLKLLLWFLYPVHIFWFVLILKVAQKALFSGQVQGDDRSDSEDDEVEPTKGPKGRDPLCIPIRCASAAAVPRCVDTSPARRRSNSGKGGS
jgi:hypothetical protein